MRIKDGGSWEIFCRIVELKGAFEVGRGIVAATSVHDALENDDTLDSLLRPFGGRQGAAFRLFGESEYGVGVVFRVVVVE